jgi:Zn finger protein HypA/HybF involved in hydrogenase expression
MKNCKKCGGIFEPQKGLINYCSLVCRNSRVWSEEDKIKKSNSNKNSIKVKEGIKKKNEWFDYKKHGEKIKETWNKKILEEDFLNLSFQRLKKRIVLEQNSKCNHCGICEWNGKSIVLELEHINGDNQNNDRDNLEAICPNCHSQTSTWRGKNKKTNRFKISDDEIVKSFLKLKNIRQTLIDVGLTPKGGNYKRVHRLIKLYNLAP